MSSDNFQKKKHRLRLL